MTKVKGTRPCAIVGNWKMHKTIDDAVQFARALLPLIQKASSLTYIAPPFTAIQAMVAAFKDSLVRVGAQNMNDATEGAFTGEIAAPMLKEVGAQFVILGHSERRLFFGEDNAFINRKVVKALSESLQPIVCIGETLEEYEAGETRQRLKCQLEESLAGISPESLSSLVLAYEPIWAIGTGITATPGQAQEAHHYCREVLAELWGQTIADQTMILYGGSVRPDNTRALLDQEDIDGVLVGGASLSVNSFAQIINA